MSCKLGNGIDACSMQLVQSAILPHQPICGLIERVNISFNICRFVPGELASCLHLSVYVSNALLEVLQLLEDHRFLGVDDLLVHIVVKICNFLQTQRLLVVTLPLLSGLDNLSRNLALKTKLSQLPCLPNEENQPVAVIDCKGRGSKIKRHHAAAHIETQTLITVFSLRHLRLPFVELIVLKTLQILQKTFSLVFESLQVCHTLENFLSITESSPQLVLHLPTVKNGAEKRGEIFEFGNMILSRDRVERLPSTTFELVLDPVDVSGNNFEDLLFLFLERNANGV